MSNEKRYIPGTIKVEGREFLYVADDGKEKFVRNGLFKEVTQKVVPPIPKSGGALSENCRLWLPTGELFHALSYKGDIEGWHKQIINGADLLGLLTGAIINDNIELSDGREFKLSDCKIDS